ncbi:YheC/D like ATP-grasp [Paenibacillus sp. UNCCL117]|uniref:YheC/YheD family endospore coat-associated protein n=1 Tax=unclassified Paenibacillus TaxID=185978 RepID=UPI000887BABA|nr:MULTISPECIES: YheC/YheD family protein [unclassified Paenibacillus]SDC08150.1 YheC/D like ATP-grasp [Paenibacillus sp. cl123]SFW38196.1 YheC/D like ATP-grasp [Paenibacillus sp. UNCCL117]
MEGRIQNTRQRPTLAILTYADEKRVFRGNQENFIDLIRAGEERGVLVYVMTTADFKLSGKQAVGYRYRAATKSWKRELLPMPHVIYNRIPYRKFEVLPEVQQVIQTCLRHSRVRFFNPSFFNKWTMFEWLNKSKLTKPYIPETKKLSSGEDIDKLLQSYPFLYLKPIRGKAGKGIMKVSRTEGRARAGQFELSIQDKTRSQISRYPTVSQLWSQVRELVGSKDYIIQQGIALSSYKRRPFDLRVLVQKNYKGHWTVAGVGARLAGRSSITTHVPRGGSIDDPGKLLAHAFGQTEGKKIIRTAKQAALLIAKQVEASSGQTLGEMSMDLGVDNDGHIWFFEANSKPMKFDEPPIRQKSLENLIRYSIFLSRKNGSQG